jgi:hypothetical protein
MRVSLCVLFAACFGISCTRSSSTPVIAASPPPALEKVQPVRGPPASHVAFWAWVSQHLAELKAVKTGQEPIAAQLGAEVEKVDPGLTYELSIGQTPFELIISADGKKELFPLVRQLVEAAPPLEGTKVIAFRPRKDTSTEFQSEHGKMAGGDLSFIASRDEEKAGLIALTVFVKGMTSSNRDAFENTAFMILELAVGEFDIETKIGAIDFRPTAISPAPGAKALAELPGVVDGWGR